MSGDPSGVLSEYLREYRRMRAECRYLLCREVYAMYHDYPGRNHGVVPTLRWYPPGKGWTKLEPGPVSIPHELVWTTRTAPIDVFRNQLRSFSWNWFGYRSTRGTRAVVSFGPIYRGPPDTHISKQSVSMRDAVSGHADPDWGNPAVREQYAKLVQGHYERWTLINSIFQSWQNLRASCEAVVSHVVATHTAAAGCSVVPAMRNGIGKNPFVFTPLDTGTLSSINVKKVVFESQLPVSAGGDADGDAGSGATGQKTTSDDPEDDPFVK
jgi:hypothetical protein